MTAKPMKSTNDKIDELLNSYGIDFSEDFNDMQEEDRKYHLADFKTQLAKLIKETLQECIGEEEKPDSIRMAWMVEPQNVLRQEAHAKLEELLQESQQNHNKT